MLSTASMANGTTKPSCISACNTCGLVATRISSMLSTITGSVHGVSKACSCTRIQSCATAAVPESNTSSAPVANRRIIDS